MKENKLFIFVVVALSCFLLSAQGIAADKIGYVNVQEIVVTSDAGKKMSEGLKRTVEKDKIAIQQKEAELKRLKDDLDKQRSILKEDARREKELNFQKKYRDYQVMAKDMNDELQAKEQDIIKKILPDVMKIIRTIGEKENYTMIMDPYVLQLPYFDRRQEITKRVLAEFNRTYRR